MNNKEDSVDLLEYSRKLQAKYDAEFVDCYGSGPKSFLQKREERNAETKDDVEDLWKSVGISEDKFDCLYDWIENLYGNDYYKYYGDYCRALEIDKDQATAIIKQQSETSYAEWRVLKDQEEERELEEYEKSLSSPEPEVKQKEEVDRSFGYLLLAVFIIAVILIIVGWPGGVLQ